MTKNDPQGFLIRFLDGPLAGKGNLVSVAGTRDVLVSSDGWTWPLPKRLGTLSHLAFTGNVAMWDADGEGATGCPPRSGAHRGRSCIARSGSRSCPTGPIA
jgi:hypothetical protein